MSKENADRLLLQWRSRKIKTNVFTNWTNETFETCEIRFMENLDLMLRNCLKNIYWSVYLFIHYFSTFLFEIKLYLVRDCCLSLHSSLVSSRHKRNLMRFLLTCRCLSAKIAGFIMDFSISKKFTVRLIPNMACGWMSV